MSAIKKYRPSIISALLMCIILLIIYPHYQYYVDPDGTAYLTISKRYAIGDIHRAINGYWSPWACWLTAAVIRMGFHPITAGIIVNTVGALGFLFISHSLFVRFNIQRVYQWLLDVTLALFLCYAIFWQSFDDLWECFFLLATLRLMLVRDFLNRPGLWILSGLIGSLAYFAKAYSFPFFILNTIVCTYILSRDNKKKWLSVSGTAIGVMVLFAFPWIYALHDKYGIWMTSTAGSLNMSWYLVGHPYWKPGVGRLLPPVYPDSPYYWEDPYLVNGPAPRFWNSWHLLGLQMVRIGLNAWKFIVSSFQLSVFFIVIIGCVKWALFWQKRIVFQNDQRVVMLSLLLFPAGYVLVNFESRYIWYMVPLGMLLSALYMQRKTYTGYKKLWPYFFAVNFLIFPVLEMIKMYNVGKEDYIAAMQLRQRGIRGSFTGLIHPGKEAQRMERLAYFSGLQFYRVPQPDSCSLNEILDGMNRYHINYLVKPGRHEQQQLPDGRVLPDITGGKIDDLSIFQVNAPGN